MNDWWDYLEHSELGKERKGHKYYARVRTGTNKLGFPQYRYFYDAREYGAYMTRQNNRYSPKFNGKKGQTYFVTGKGSTMVDSRTANADIQRAKALDLYTTHYLSKDGYGPTGATATNRAKTVKDHKKLRQAKRNVQAAAKKGKAKVASLLRKAANKIDS